MNIGDLIQGEMGLLVPSVSDVGDRNFLHALPKVHIRMTASRNEKGEMDERYLDIWYKNERALSEYVMPICPDGLNYDLVRFEKECVRDILKISN